MSRSLVNGFGLGKVLGQLVWARQQCIVKVLGQWVWARQGSWSMGLG